MQDSYIIGAIIVAALATFTTRVIPFLLFSYERAPRIDQIHRA